MTEQLGFLGAATISQSGRPLTVKQGRVLDLVKYAPGGLTAEQVGAQLHADRGRHSADRRCDWCSSEATGVLRSKGLRGLVIRRRTGRWEARDGSTPPAHVEPSSQIRDGLPGWLGGEE